MINPTPRKGITTRKFGGILHWYLGRTLFNNKARSVALQLESQGVKTRVTQRRDLGWLIWGNSNKIWLDLSEPIYNPMSKVHPLAIEAKKKWKEDVRAGHGKGEEYWAGYAGAAYLLSNPNWRSLSYLYDPGEKVEPVYCTICRKMVIPAKIANTELVTHGNRYSACNVALKLECGHIVVDDCSLNSYNGMTFRTEAEWRKKIVSRREYGLKNTRNAGAAYLMSNPDNVGSKYHPVVSPYGLPAYKKNGVWYFLGYSMTGSGKRTWSMVLSPSSYRDYEKMDKVPWTKGSLKRIAGQSTHSTGNPVRLTVRKTVYRDKPGYLVYGNYDHYTGQKIFFSKESQAREFIRRIKEGENSGKILQDIWKTKNPILPEIASGVTAGLGLGVGFKLIDHFYDKHVKKNPITQKEIDELVDLYHLAQTPVGRKRYDRLVWAAKEFHKAHPDISSTRAYIEADYATRSYKNPRRKK